MRISKTFETNDSNLKKRLLAWASRQEVCCILNSNSEKQTFRDAYSQDDFVVAVGAVDQIHSSSNQQITFDQLKEFYETKKDWLFGFLSYDLKNEIENLSSANNDRQEFPGFHFFQPRLVLKIENGKLKIEILYLEKIGDEHSVSKIIDEILQTEINVDEDFEVDIRARVSEGEYVSTVNKIKNHIHRGDIYEMNYCVEFFAEQSTVHPSLLYEKLNELSPMPFSCFYKMNHHYAMCASPERFVARRGNKIISQPIKGTARRGKTSEEDKRIIEQLRNDPKELSENVMIVDLVRNDLSRTAAKGSVKVEELFGVYTFQQLHQLISTVTSEVKNDIKSSDVIKNLFPMGSMTGAPKVRAMQLIEEFEKTKRGLYSGSIGYFSPGGNFDFNVMIRTILYNEQNHYLSFMVGSAITAKSNPEKEYEECLLKANAMMSVLRSTSNV